MTAECGVESEGFLQRSFILAVFHLAVSVYALLLIHNLRVSPPCVLQKSKIRGLDRQLQREEEPEVTK